MPAAIDALPDGPGVYLFHGENDLPLYVGKSTGIRKRVLAHFAADHATAKEMASRNRCGASNAFRPAAKTGALLKEAALIKKLQPIHNRSLRRNDELCFWQLVEARQGEWRPQLVLSSEPCRRSAESSTGPSRQHAKPSDVLQELAREHHLCHALLGLEKLKPGRPCFAHQVHQCKGACVGKEPVSFHSARLMAALGKIALRRPGPLPGPAWMREGNEVHLIDRWRHLGTVGNDADLQPCWMRHLPPFDQDSYRILLKFRDRMSPLAAVEAGLAAPMGAGGLRNRASFSLSSAITAAAAFSPSSTARWRSSRLVAESSAVAGRITTLASTSSLRLIDCPMMAKSAAAGRSCCRRGHRAAWRKYPRR
jgi:DNA polymerase-3 subunit epsilon